MSRGKRVLGKRRNNLATETANGVSCSHTQPDIGEMCTIPQNKTRNDESLFNYLNNLLLSGTPNPPCVCVYGAQCKTSNAKKKSKTKLKLQRSSGVLRDHHHHHNCKLEEDGNLPCLCAKERKRKTAAVRVSVAANRTEEKGKWHFHEWSKAGCVDVLCCVVRTWEIIIKLSSASCNGRKKPLCFGTPAVQNSSSRHRYLERPRRPPLSDTI